MKRWHTREASGIGLDRALRWWHDEEPVEHPRIIEAFNQGLKVDAQGRFKLEFGGDWCFVTVEDAAYAVLALDALETGLTVRLSDRTSEPLDPATLAVGADGVVSARVKAGRAKARFSRDAQFALGSLLEPEGEGLVLRVGERRWPTPLAGLASVQG